MDTTAPPIRSKRRKLLRRRADASCDKDLISKFPEDILVHILSFLSTQEAIRTSILSKRWKYLWQSSPKFFFLDPSLAWPSRKKKDDIEDLEATFYGSIERAVTLRNCSCLVELSLVLGAQVAATQLQSWLSAAQKHEVQKLILCLPKHGEIILPDSLFTAKSLGSFWLETSCTLKVPSFICFSSLKILSLVNVVFEDDQSTQHLLSGCPLLERLHLVDCDWGNIVTISIENPTLRSLTFSDRLYPYHFSNAKIMISALNLETICVAGRLRVELLLCNLPSLKSASIDIQKWSEGQQTVKLLTGLKNVKTLNLSTETLEFLFGGGNLLGQLPTFCNVTYLKAYMRSPYYYTTNKDHASGALLYILQKSPNVEFLEVPKVLIREEQHLISKPTNILSSRKESIVCDVRRNEYEVRN